MKPVLGLRAGQTQVISPQTQQAMRLLQLSAIELSAAVQEALESNPMLDSVEDAGEGDDPTSTFEAEDTPAADADPVPEPLADAPESVQVGELSDLDLNRQDTFPDDLPVDTTWESVYGKDEAGDPGQATFDADAFQVTTPWELPSRNRPTPDLPDLPLAQAGDESLTDHLLWQLGLLGWTGRRHLIGRMLIDAIDRHGYLCESVEDIAASLPPQESPPGCETPLAEVESALRAIQQFDPAGVGARTPSEALSLQLRQHTDDPALRDLAIRLVEQHLGRLANRDVAGLRRALKCDETRLAEATALIESLNPRPGSGWSAEPTRYVIPDLIARKVRGGWRVSLNEQTQPRVRINRAYACLVQRGDNSRDGRFLRDSLMEANWFMRCLQGRQETLLLVARHIVEFQQAFLEHGDEAMRPLVLQDVAEAVGLHDSTVSRATSRKYMHTPRGVLPLKRFFSSHVAAGGGQISSTAVRAHIRKLIDAEDPARPLSDNKIAAILADRNITIARRTVAKYRESISIPTSSERRRLA